MFMFIHNVFVKWFMPTVIFMNERVYLDPILRLGKAKQFESKVEEVNSAQLLLRHFYPFLIHLNDDLCKLLL